MRRAATARGSSSSSSALVEASRRGVAPCAIVLVRADPILAIGSLVTADLYGIHIPVVLLPEQEWDNLPQAGTAIVDASEATGCVHSGVCISLVDRNACISGGNGRLLTVCFGTRSGES